MEACGAPPPADLAARLAAARALLRSAWPAAAVRESVRGAGRTFFYSPAGGPVVLRLVVDPPNLLLHFAEGAVLADPADLLSGAGRRGRYICLGAVSPDTYPALLALIAAATQASGSARVDVNQHPGATA